MHIVQSALAILLVILALGTAWPKRSVVTSNDEIQVLIANRLMALVLIAMAYLVLHWS